MVEGLLRQALGLSDSTEGLLSNTSVLQRITALEEQLYNSVLQRITALEQLSNTSVLQRITVAKRTEPLSARELAKRLGFKSHHPVSDRKSKADFSSWSAGLDPHGVGWEHRDGKFYPTSATNGAVGNSLLEVQ